jgi:hypothetical protein
MTVQISVADWIQATMSIVTAAGVGIAAWQLHLTKEQAQAQFEDSLTEQYRRITADLPLQALLGKPLADGDLDLHLRPFYEYFDLSNEQAFLASNRRLRASTWQNWKEGIEQHLSRPAFKQAWMALDPHLDGSFDSLRALFPAANR